MMPASPAPDHKLPEYYQQADTEQLFRWLAAGESCALVEPGSVRLHPLLPFMCRASIRERYLDSAQAPAWVMVLLNPYQLLSLQTTTQASTGDSWPGYELMLDRLGRRLTAMLHEGALLDQRQQADSLIEYVAGCQQRLYDALPLRTQAALRSLEDALGAVLRFNQQMRLVFLFDQLEGFVQLPAEFWQSLYGLRDAYGGRLMFVTGSSRPPGEILRSGDAADNQPHAFVGLFNGFTRSISRLDGPSTRAVIETLEKRYDLALPGDLVRILSYTVGRHPVMLGRGYQIAAQLGDVEISDENFLNLLLDDEAIGSECQAIYDSLPDAEQAILREIVHQSSVDTGSLAWHSLLGKHLVTLTDEQRPVLTIPIFAMYIRDHLAL